MFGARRSGDDRGNSIVIKDPALCELSHRQPGGNLLAEPLCQRDSLIEWESGKSLSDIEHRSVAIVIAVVLLPKDGLCGELSGQ